MHADRRLRRRARSRFAWAVAAALPCGWCTIAVLHAQTPETEQDTAFLEGLRARRLTAVAENFCKERLSWAELPVDRRVELTVQWSRAVADAALQADPDSADALWKRARDVLGNGALVLGEQPRIVLIRAQEALLELQQGESLALQAVAAGGRTELLDAARNRLREGNRQLQKQVKLVTEALDRQKPGPVPPGDFNERERLNLQQNLRRQLARGHRLLAETYPAGSADRLDLLNLSLTELTPIADRDPTEPNVYGARLERATCLRLQGQGDAANAVLEGLAKEEALPESLRKGLLAETIRTALVRGRLAEALSAAERRNPVGDVLELDLAALEATLAAWKQAQARGTADAAIHRTKAGGLVNSIRERHGPYWGRRAIQLEAGTAVADTAGNADPEALARAADNFYVTGNPDEAIKNYDRASAAARNRGQAALAFDLAYKAATVEHKRQNSVPAAERFFAVALSEPQNPRAAEAHLWGIYHAGQVARKNDAPDLTEYRKRLDENLARWPQGATAGQARLWLGKVFEGERKLPEAAAQYAAVSARDGRFAQAVEALDAVSRKHLNALRDAGEPIEAWARITAERFAQMLPTASDATWTPGHRKAALAAATFCLDDVPGKYEQAANILQTALKDAPPEEAEWISAARRILIVAEAGRGRTEEATVLLNALGSGSSQQLLKVLDELARIAADASPELRREIAKVQLESIKLLEAKAGELSPAEQKQLNLAYARAVALAENRAKALAIYATLVKTYPQEAKMQEEYALLLMEETDPAMLKAAVERWQLLERGSKAGSDRWFRAKYHTARATARLGDKAAAAKQVDVLEILHPELGGPAWKARFEQLRKDSRP